MSWVKLDDSFYSHPKARAAGKDGRELYLAGLCWTKRHLTDGVIPKAAGKLLCAQAEVPWTIPARLVEIRLWHDEGDHWRINDFHEHNESAEDERKRRADQAERMRRWRAKRDAERDALRDALLTLPDTDTDTDIKEGVKDPSLPPGLLAEGEEEEADVISITRALGTA